MDLLNLLEGVRLPAFFQIICWSYLTIIHIVLFNFLLHSQWFTIFLRKAPVSDATKANLSTIHKKKKIEEEHETARYLRCMIQNDGAGTWPPTASHGSSWPAALRPYHDIYLELERFLSCLEVSLDEQENLAKIRWFRARMQELLRERVDLLAVEAILFSALEAGDNHAFSLGDLNGFFACVSLSRHAFRWGTIPVVKCAQEETVVDFPRELDLPWEYLSRHFCIKSPGGNVTSNYLCNFDRDERLAYQINSQMSEMIKSAEYHFAHVFPAMEREALPLYHNMVASITHYEKHQKKACLSSLRQISQHLSIPLKIYYDTLVESKISRAVWMPYVQGFQGWAAGEMQNGVYVEYDGLSGNQLPMSFFIDAFLGLAPYLTEENMLRYIPISQRKLRESLSAHSFREKAKQDGDVEIEEEMLKIVRHMRVFRAAHRARVIPYLSTPAPERFIMTAGKSVLESETIQTVESAIEFLDHMLEGRLKATS